MITAVAALLIATAAVPQQINVQLISTRAGIDEPAGVHQCLGDCNGNGRVDLGEVVLLLNIALGRKPSDTCASLRRDPGIYEIVLALNDSLRGCPVAVGTPGRAIDCEDIRSGAEPGYVLMFSAVPEAAISHELRERDSR